MLLFSPDSLAATFVSFLLEVDSVYEVHDYIKSYLGETKDAHDFAKQFLDRRQKVKAAPTQQVASTVLTVLLFTVHVHVHVVHGFWPETAFRKGT